MAQKIARSGYSRGKNRNSGTWMVIVVLLVISLLSATVFSLLWQGVEDRNREKDSSSSNNSSSSDPISSTEDSSSSSSLDSSTSVETSDSQAESDESSSEGSSSSVSYEPVEYGVPVPQQERVKSEYFDDAIFVGDSITDGIRSYGVMSNTTVIAYTGVNPETILSKKLIGSGEEKVTFLEAMAQHPDAKKIYIMMGANGIAWLTKDTFIADYGAFIDQVKAQHPNALIYIQSILPVTQSYEEKNPEITNTTIDEFNQALLELTKEKNVYYLNIAESFKDENGALPEEASSDGMHFATQYYNIWFDYLKEHAIQSN